MSDNPCSAHGRDTLHTEREMRRTDESPERLASLQAHVRTLLEQCSPRVGAIELGGPTHGYTDADLDGEAWAVEAARLIGMDPSEIGSRY